MNEVSAILGADLIRHQDNIDFADGFADLLHPQGFNIVVMEVPHNDMFIDMRLIMLFKIVNQEEPLEGNLTIPYVIYKQIMQRINVGDKNVH